MYKGVESGRLQVSVWLIMSVWGLHILLVISLESMVW